MKLMQSQINVSKASVYILFLFLFIGYCNAKQSITVQVLNQSADKFKHHYDAEKLAGFRWDNELVERKPDELFVQDFSSCLSSSNWNQVHEIEGFEEPVTAEIFVEIFRAEDYELVKRTVLSDGPEFDVPEQGAYIIRCATTVQVCSTEEYVKGRFGLEDDTPSGMTPPALAGNDESGRYEVYQIKEFCREVSVFGVGGNGVFEYGWKYYKRYTYWVASETRAFVFSGQKNKALVTLINDHDILANLAYDPKDGGAQVVSISPVEQGLTVSVAKTAVSKSFEYILKHTTNISDYSRSFVSGAAANIIIAGVLDKSIDGEFLLKMGIKLGVTAGAKMILVKVGVASGPAGWIVAGGAILFDGYAALWKSYNLGLFYADDWIRDEVYYTEANYKKYCDISICNYGTPIQNVRFMTAKGGNTKPTIGDIPTGFCNTFSHIAQIDEMFDYGQGGSYTVRFDVAPFLRDLLVVRENIRSGLNTQDAEIIRDYNKWYNGSLSGQSQKMYGFYMPANSSILAQIQLQVSNPAGWTLSLTDQYGSEIDNIWTPINDGYALAVGGLQPGPYVVRVSGTGGAYQLGFIDFPDVAKAASVVSVIDISGSMAGTKLASAKSASNAFIDMMSSGDKIGIVSFGSSASVRYSLTEIGDPEDTVKNQAKSAVSALSTSGSTAMGLGIRGANTELNRFPDDPKRVMIVMTDGQENVTPYAVDVINNELADDIQIFTIGFEVNESIMNNLRSLAQLRNGQAYAAPTPDELRNVYYKVIVAAVQEQLLGVNGQIDPGAEATHTVYVDAATSSADFDLSWGGSDLDLILIDPDGNEIPRQTDELTGVEFIETATTETYRINLPTPGTWRVKIIGIDVPSMDYPYKLFAFAESQVETTVTVPAGPHAAGALVDIQVQINDGAPIAGAAVIATITPPASSGEDAFTIGLEDSGDGLYGAAFDRTFWGGDYEVEINIYGMSSLGFWFSRSPSATFNVSAPALPFITIEDNWIFERNDGSNALAFTAKLSEPSSLAVTVEYATENDTAAAGLDYFAVSGNITFEPGETEVTISVPVMTNNQVHLNRTFFINLNNPSNAVLGRTQATGTIIDADLRSDATVAGVPKFLTYVDGNGTRVYVMLEESTADVWFSGDNIKYYTHHGLCRVSGKNLSLDHIFLKGTSFKTKLRFEVTGGKQSTIGSIYADGSVGVISGDKINIRGGIQVLGGLNRLVLNDVLGPSSIIIGPPASTNQSLEMWFRRVDNLSLTSETPIKSVTAKKWLNSGNIEEIIAASKGIE